MFQKYAGKNPNADSDEVLPKGRASSEPPEHARSEQEEPKYEHLALRKSLLIASMLSLSLDDARDAEWLFDTGKDEPEGADLASEAGSRDAGSGFGAMGLASVVVLALVGAFLGVRAVCRSTGVRF